MFCQTTVPCPPALAPLMTFPEAHRLYRGLVRGLLHRLLGRDADIDDLVQETFFRLFRATPTLTTAEAARAYVVGICFRVALEERRRQRTTRARLISLDVLPDVPGHGSDEDAREALRRTIELLDRMSERDRSIYLKHHVEGTPLAALSDELGLSVSTMGRRLKHVLERLTTLGHRDPALRPYVAPAARDQRPVRNPAP